MADPNDLFLQQQFGGAPTSTDPNTAFLQSVFGGAAPTPAGPRVAKDLGDAFAAGLQDKTLGLMLRGKKADVTLGEDSTWGQRAMAGFGGLLSDAPAMLVGAVAGGVVGTAAGPAGTVVGAGAGSFAVPMALREALIQSYSGGHATSWEGAWEIAKAGLKGAVIGGATAGVGRFLAPVLPATMGAAAKATTVVGAELGTMTTTAAALEGHMPTAQDFIDNAILLGGMKGVIKTATSLRSVFAQTGKTPAEVAVDAARDPQLKAELMGEAQPLSVAELAKGLPPTEQGFVRLYRGEFGGVPSGGIWATKDAGTALFYAETAPQNLNTKASSTRVVWQDVPAAAVNRAGPGEFTVDRNYQNKWNVLREDSPQLKAELTEQRIPRAYEPLALEQRVKAALDADKRAEVVASLMKMEKDPNAKIDSPVKYDYIFDKETADGVVAGIAEVWKSDIETQARGKVPVRQAAVEAANAIKDGELSQPREVGAADNSGIVMARALLAKGSAENAQKLAETLPRDPAQWSLEHKLQWAGAMEQTAMLYAQYRGAGAEAARSLNMFWQLKRDPSLLGNAEQMVKLYERDAKQGDFATMAAMVRSFKDPEAVQAFAKSLNKPGFWPSLIEPWRAAIFSGPMTWSANINGNIAKWNVEVADNTVAASLTAARRAIAGDPLSMAQYKARAFAPLYGAQMAALDGIHLIAEGKKLVETNGWAGVKQGAKAVAERLSKEDDKIDVYRRANDPNSSNPIESAAGYLASASFGMLKAQDLPFRTIGERAEGHKLAVDRATAEGWHPKTREWTEAVARYSENPEYGLTAKAAAETMTKISEAGSKAVFGERLGPLTERLSAAISGTPWEFLFPARRTPANLLSWAVQHTPGLNLFSGRWREDFAAGGERRDAALARVAVGTALAATAYGLVTNGMLTGGGLIDKEMAKTKAGAGEQPYSLFLGGEYYGIQRIEPVAKVLMLTADLHEILNSPKIGDDDKAKAAAMLALAFGNATISTTYMSGLSNAMRAVLDPERYGQGLIESYATSLIPKFIGQTTTMADPYKREVDGALEAIQSQLPYFRTQLMAKRDVWGEPSKNNRWFEVMPVATSVASKDKVKTEAVRLMIGLADAPKYATGKGPFKPSDKSIELTGEQRDVFRQIAGGKALEFLSPIVNADDWDRMPAYAQVNTYKKVIAKSRDMAAWEALPANSQERQDLQRKIMQRIIQETDAVK